MTLDELKTHFDKRLEVAQKIAALEVEGKTVLSHLSHAFENQELSGTAGKITNILLAISDCAMQSTDFKEVKLAATEVIESYPTSEYRHPELIKRLQGNEELTDKILDLARRAKCNVLQVSKHAAYDLQIGDTVTALYSSEQFYTIVGFYDDPIGIAIIRSDETGTQVYRARAEELTRVNQCFF